MKFSVISILLLICSCNMNTSNDISNNEDNSTTITEAPKVILEDLFIIQSGLTPNFNSINENGVEGIKITAPIYNIKVDSMHYIKAISKIKLNIDFIDDFNDTMYTMLDKVIIFEPALDKSNFYDNIIIQEAHRVNTIEYNKLTAIRGSILWMEVDVKAVIFVDGEVMKDK